MLLSGFGLAAVQTNTPWRAGGSDYALYQHEQLVDCVYASFSILTFEVSELCGAILSGLSSPRH